MAFKPRLTDVGIRDSPWWYSTGNIFYAAGYGMPNCTCYAYGRFAEIAGAFQKLPGGNGGEWWAQSEPLPYKRGQEPKLGAVICFNGNPGHVAVVEEISDGGENILTSNSAYQGTFFWTETLTKSAGYVPTWARNLGYSLGGFIYNDVVTGIAGASAYVIAAIAGCFAVESNVNPGVWESLTPSTFDHVYQYDGIGGYGLGQWTNIDDPHGRLWKMYEYLTSHGFASYDGYGQLEYIIAEDYWANSPQTRGDYKTLSEYLASKSTDLSDLVWDWLANWEGVPGNAFELRLDYAEKFYKYIIDHKDDNPSNYKWISKNSFLTLDQMYNNVMCMYFYLSNGDTTPPGGVGTIGGGKMPMAFYLRRKIGGIIRI